MIKNIRHHIKLIESLEDWTKDWVHFSDQPILTMNPKPMHSDPVGIYFFPEDFSSNSYWSSKAYRFEAKLDPNAKVLDVSKITQEQLDQLIDITGTRESYDDYINQYPKDDIIKRFDMAWEVMQRGRFESRLTAAKWNKRIRDAGWDAIFDDTGSIHSAEAQLLVLNPRVIFIKTMIRQKPNVYNALMKVIDDLVKICEPFGSVTVDKPKREKKWGVSSETISGNVEIRRNEDNYADFRVSHTPATTRQTVDINMRWSSPRLNYGSGATYEISTQKYQFTGLESIVSDLKKIFPDS